MPAQQKQWTVMVYLAGDNDLDSFGTVDLKEMKKVGSSAEVNVLAQFDCQGSKGTRRFYLRKNTTLAHDSVKDLGETNTGGPAVLETFVRWAFKEYPAAHYLLVLWNHGAGWDDTNIYRSLGRRHIGIKRRGVSLTNRRSRQTATSRNIHALGQTPTRRALFNSTVAAAAQRRAIAFDDNARDFLDNLELKRVLKSLTQSLKRKLDILGMDACLMNMLEVAYQVRDSAQLTVGSEEVEPGDGWPYDRILRLLVQRPESSPQELAGIIVNRSLASYPTDAQVTQSVVLTDRLPVAAVDELAKQLLRALPDPAQRSAIVDAGLAAQSYDTVDYVDLFDFCELLAATSSAALHDACEAVKTEISRAVVASGFRGNGVEGSHGVSIYFPEKKISPLYGNLDFSGKTKWDEFVSAYIATTRGRGRRAAAVGADGD